MQIRIITMINVQNFSWIIWYSIPQKYNPLLSICVHSILKWKVKFDCLRVEWNSSFGEVWRERMWIFMSCGKPGQSNSQYKIMHVFLVAAYIFHLFFIGMQSYYKVQIVESTLMKIWVISFKYDSMHSDDFFKYILTY